jgi:hypothetical protein
MTRRGSLVYYLAGWVCGSFFLAVAVWLHAFALHTQQKFSSNAAGGLLTVYFFTLAFGWFQSIFAAFFLRRIAIFAKFNQAWQWALTGAALWPLLIFILNKIGNSANWNPDNAEGGWTMFVSGAMIVSREAIWIAAPAGALAALVLFSVNRSFMPSVVAESDTTSAPGDASETTGSKTKKNKKKRDKSS